MSAEDLDGRSTALARAFRDQGSTLGLSGEERPFRLDLVPRVVEAHEWEVVERGVAQRVWRGSGSPTGGHHRGRDLGHGGLGDGRGRVPGRLPRRPGHAARGGPAGALRQRGWDPTNGIPAGERHVLVARGRDSGDVTPLKAEHSGGGSQSVGVTVEVTRLA